jgi:hypothetical protein
MKWTLVVVVLAACLAGGCSDRNSIQDVTIANAPNLTGQGRCAVCDTCHQRSDCGTTERSSVWAMEHAKLTHHKTFTREACQTGLDLSLGVKAQQQRELKMQDVQALANSVFTNGLPLYRARMETNQSGTVEHNGPDKITVRFRQTVTDGTRSAWREVWADFDPVSTALTDVKYGPWNE